MLKSWLATLSLFIASLSLIAIAALLLLDNSPREIPVIEKVVVPRELLDELSKRYYTSSDEFLYCLQGEVKNRTLIVAGYSEAEHIVSAAEDSVVGSCSRDTVASVHPHFNKVCKLSLADAYSLGLAKDYSAGVLCGPETIAFYTPKSLINAVDWEVV